MQLLDEGHETSAAAMLDQALQSPTSWPRARLSVLRSPGGDPGLLTLRSLRALHEADAIIYDPRCQEEPVLAMARRDAERLPVDLEEWVGSAEVSEQLQALLRSHGRLVLLLNDMPSEAYGKLLILLAGVQRSVSILTSAEALSLEIQAMPS